MQADAMPARRPVKLLAFGRGECATPEKLDTMLSRLDGAFPGDDRPIVAEATLCRLEPFRADDWDEIGVRPIPTADHAEPSLLLTARCHVLARAKLRLPWLDEGGWPIQFEVDEHVFLHGDALCEPGVRRIGLLSRADVISRSEFSQHWRNNHAPLVLDEDPLFDRYVSNVVIGDSAWDAVVEQRFSSIAALRRHDALIRTSRPAIAADIPSFLGGSTMYLAFVAARRGPGRSSVSLDGSSPHCMDTRSHTA